MRSSTAHRYPPICLILFALFVSLMVPGIARAQFDKQHAPCFAPDPSNDPACDLIDWSNPTLTQNRVAFLYSNERLVQLERMLKALTSSPKRFDDGYSGDSAVFWAFQRMMGGLPSDQQARINRWAKAFPASEFAPLAQGRLTYDNAWRLRGEGYGSTVSKESWALYAAGLKQAMQTLMDAPKSARDRPAWHHHLLAISLDSSGLSEGRAVFNAAVQRWPDYYDFYHTVLGRMLPQWGGNWKAVDAFISDWSARRAATDGASLYARLYAALHRQQAHPSETLATWARMKPAFDDLIKLHPAARFRNRYASHACFYRDKGAFEKAMSTLIAPQILREEWLRGHSYEACAHWASAAK